ncbi:hypothetical protein ABMA28_015361 [Loxostege sticticalis]|uniref:Uncharacterized protein n=1 Tax=Loxostege sticticalis TaxID=481309 RepID=A0ABD0TCJ6_LOXSC
MSVIKTVKCTSCNIVISEVLAFIRSRHDVMDTESLIRLCGSAFSEEDVNEAKLLLFSSTKTKHKLISRRKERKQKDLEDIISVFKTTDPDQLPVFVAYYLHKLPPVSFDHIDVSKLLKDILFLRGELAEIKENFVTKKQLDDSMQKVSNSILNPVFNANVNKMRGGGYAADSGPFGLQPLTDESVTATRAQDDTVPHSADFTEPTYRPLALSCTQDAPCAKDVSPAPVNSTILESIVLSPNAPVDTANKNKMTMAEILNNGEWTKTKPDDGWISVQKNKYRNRFDGKTGTASLKCTGRFKAAETKIPLFISNVNKETTEQDICEYVEKMTQETVVLEKITMKNDRPYNAFKLFVTKHKMHIFLNDKLWPEGIRFRRFVFFKREKTRDVSSPNDKN